MLKVKDGIITSDKIKIIQHLIPISNKEAWGYSMSPLYITIHNTGNPNVSAKNNSIYVDKENGYVSWHFTIGDKEIYQELPITISGWHAGDKKGTGNLKSIGIEIAEVDGAEEMAIKFVAELLIFLNMSIDKVVPHKHWSGKNCPRLILPHWDIFIENIKKEMNYIMLTVDEAKKLLKANANIDDNSIQYLEYYRFGDDLIKKLASAMTNDNSPIDESKPETPIETPKVEYKKYSNMTELKGNPESLDVAIVDKKIWDITEFTNCANGTYYWRNADGTTYATSILYVDGKTYQDVANHYYDFGTPQSVFIIYKDNTVDLKRINFLNELDLNKIRLVIGGLGVRNTLDPNFKYSPVTEGFKAGYRKQDNKWVDYSDVLRKTNKTVLGYNKRLNKIYLLTVKNVSHGELINIISDNSTGEAYDLSISLDSGGSSFMDANGEYVFQGENGRRIHNIVGFNLF